MARLSVELQRYFFEEERSDKVTLADILGLAGERMFGFLFVILSLPSALPVPAPGYSIPFGVVMFLLAMQLIAGAKRPWIPQKMLKGTMKLEKVQGLVRTGIPWLRRIESISRPRLTYLCNSWPGRVAIGVAIALMSVSMMIIIPGTNTLPAIGIFVTGFGLMQDDGVVSLGGLVLCVMAGIVSASIIIALAIGGSSLLDVIKDLL